MFKITNFTVNFSNEPICVDADGAVRFSWAAESDTQNWLQKSYRITVSSDSSQPGGADCWDSGTVECGRSDNILYEGKPLAECTPYWVKVRVVSEDGQTEEAETRFETTLSDASFTAKWIAQKNSRQGWAQYLRREFRTDPQKKIARARAYFSGLGVGELYINGKKQGDAVFDPALTNYERTVLFNTYDITPYLNSGTGENAVGILLGDGWYCQRRAWYTITHYGDPRARLEIHLFYEDGSRDILVSDESFRGDYSPITLNNVHGGETYDARMEQPGWDCAGFDDAKWDSVTVMDPPGGRMTPANMPPIRKTRIVKPVSVQNRHRGSLDQVFIYDMGENFAGFVKIKIPNSPPGAEYVLRFAEDTDSSGGLWHSSEGPQHTCVMQQDRYIAKGFGADTEWEPRFTYHGFRYVEVTGVYTHQLPPEDFLTGYAVNTDVQSNGDFTCSHSGINGVQTLTRRTILSNLHGFPEDCPVREKCGWLGDAQLVCEAAIYNYDMRLLYEKYLDDIRTTRDVNGTWMMIAPGRRHCGEASPLWGCAQVLIPWAMYLYYNDRLMLTRYYDYMCAWVQHELDRSEDYVIDVGLGDWCPPRPPVTEEDPKAERKKMPVPMSSTAEFYRISSLMSKVAALLGKTEDQTRFAGLAAAIRESFNRHFFDREACSYGYQGGDGVALRYGLVPDGLEEKVAADYHRLLSEDGYQMYTGIYCNKHTAVALTEAGYSEDVMKMLFSEGNLNFAFMLANGATSLWECFDLPSSTNFPASLDHPMQGAFTSWFYSHILGITPREDAPGFKKFNVKPYRIAGVDSASGSFLSQYGKIAVDWKAENGLFTLKLTVPANTVACVTLPGGTEAEIGSGDHTFTEKL